MEKSREEIIINEEPVDLDGLNYLAGKNVDFINKSAMNGTILAHTDGNVPNLMVKYRSRTNFILANYSISLNLPVGLVDIYSALIHLTSQA